MTLLAIMGLGFFRLGTLTYLSDERKSQMVSPGLAGCGMAAFLGVVAAQALA